MKQIFAVIISLLISGMATAQPPHSHKKPVPPSTRPAPPPNWNNHHHHRPHHVHPVAPIHRPRVFVNNYHVVNGNRFRFGFYYNGFNHNHWSYHYWDTRYGTYLYYDPYVLQYFYWFAPHARYYPVTYAPAGFAFPYRAVAPAVPVPVPLPPGYEAQPQPPAPPPPAN